MSDDKKPMQADGSGSGPAKREIRGQMASDSDAPKADADVDEKESDGNFKGGQSDQAYYGKGQLGQRKVGETHNAPSSED